MRIKPLWRLLCAVCMLLLTAVGTLFVAAPSDSSNMRLVPGILLGMEAIWLGLEFYLLIRHQRRYISEMNTVIGEGAKTIPERMTIPAVLIDAQYVIVWYNDSFRQKILLDGDYYGQSIHAIVQLDKEELDSPDPIEVCLQERYYRMHHTTETYENQSTTLLWFQDITRYQLLRQQYRDTRPCVLLIVVDNYEDLFNGAKQSEKATVVAALETLFEHTLEGTESLFCRLDEDRFMVVTEAQYYIKMQHARFPMLDAARKIVVNGKTPVTLSVGVGCMGNSIAANETYAKQSLDMALGRGGDQVAVKKADGYAFYGGVSKGVERRSRTKHRAIANSLKTMIRQHQQVYIMGHRYSDLDAVGAAVGVAYIAQQLERPAHIILNPDATLAKPLVARIQQECPELLMRPQQAREQIGSEDLLIIVDTFSKEILEDDGVYQCASQVIVIDHHRKMVNYLERTALTLHDPSASSAAELVTELIRYLEFSEPCPQFYAEALLAGIMLDTKNFVMQTGVQTFEAAAFLRQMGADPIEVKLFFAATMSAYRQRSQLVANAELHGRSAIAVACEPAPELQIIAGQTADDLLGIEGVDASFVIYPSGPYTCISARSFGALNVQVVMEQMGGGGHQTMAAVQRTDCSPRELRQLLINTLDMLDWDDPSGMEMFPTGGEKSET